MFTGIIEATAKVVKATEQSPNIWLTLTRPQSFDDIKTGDSIATNGACLTVSEFNEDTITFVIGVETQKVCGWENLEELKAKTFNLERSLKVGERLHGHFVQGHVDATAEVINVEPNNDWLKVSFKTSGPDTRLIWRKGSITVSGVSLTVNEVEQQANQQATFSVGLIPETLARTNLNALKQGDVVNIEFDWLAKAARASFGHQSQGELQA